MRDGRTQCLGRNTLADGRRREVGTARHDGIALGQTADGKALKTSVSINVSGGRHAETYRSPDCLSKHDDEGVVMLLLMELRRRRRCRRVKLNFLRASHARASLPQFPFLNRANCVNVM